MDSACHFAEICLKRSRHRCWHTTPRDGQSKGRTFTGLWSWFFGGKERPSERGCYAAIQAAFSFLVERGFAPSDIVAMGFSLGGGASCYLASKVHSIRGLVLVSTFRSAAKVVSDMDNSIIDWIDLFPNEKMLGETRCPVLVLHAFDDRLIDVKHAASLAKACRGRASVHIFSDGGHYLWLRKLPEIADLVRKCMRLDQEAGGNKTAERRWHPVHRRTTCDFVSSITK
ncbi:MAG: alpha/beta hydrolase [Sulfobacillus sp.]